jgi:hypothetical protein
MSDEEVVVLGTAAEMGELVGILVRDCGCGCAYTEGELSSPSSTCGAVRALRNRRYVLGLLFARRLRRQLEAEEWSRGRHTLAQAA